jgi:D-alanyl-D-alanine carboxypeptidase/D-alanyl-D-alanine-endopeptidase (penicillin-binding protein 4)
LTGQDIYVRDADVALMPASTTKVLSAAAVLTTSDPDRTLATTTLMERTAPDQANVYLVAGGDVTLAPGEGDESAVMGHAGMLDLAGATADALRRAGIRQASVILDDSIFTGPSSYPAWQWTPGTDWGSPVAALAIMDGRAGPGFDGATYVADPALVAASQFRQLLASDAAQGRAVNLTPGTARGVAPADAALLAEVRSAPLRQLVWLELKNSDNVLADTLGRVAAVAAGLPGSFEGCASVVQQTLDAMAVNSAGVYLDDCSGLSRTNTISAATLVDLLASAASVDESRSVAVDLVRGLPVGGEDGTLKKRFTDAASLGNVRAKTGTLTGVRSLAGTVQTASGRQLVFAVVANPGAGIGADSARAELDAFVAGLAAIE